MKNNSQWKVVKIEMEGVSSFQVMKEGQTFKLLGTDKFINAIHFGDNIAIAVEVRSKKAINIQWYIINNEGFVVKTCKTLRCVNDYINSLNNESDLQI